jgi:hypothetical protein
MNNEETMKQELIKNFKSRLSDMSYYNAAEGSDWITEKEGRNKCSESLKVIAKNLKIHGINPSDLTDGYLVTAADYTEF